MILAFTAFLSAAAVQPPATETPSCIGIRMRACVSVLARYVKIDSADYASASKAGNTHDINGNLVVREASALVMAHFHKDEGYVYRAVRLAINGAGLIDGVSIEVLGDPTTARTEDDFDRTGIATLAPAFLPVGCAERDRLSFYRLFMNDIAPTTRTESSTWYSAGEGSDDTTSKSKKITVCGIRVSYKHQNGISTFEGHFDDKTLIFERDYPGRD